MSLYKIKKLANHPEHGEMIILSIKAPAEGYSRGVKWTHYGLSKDDAIAMAREILHAAG